MDRVILDNIVTCYLLNAQTKNRATVK